MDEFGLNFKQNINLVVYKLIRPLTSKKAQIRDLSQMAANFFKIADITPLTETLNSVFCEVQ